MERSVLIDFGDRHGAPPPFSIKIDRSDGAVVLTPASTCATFFSMLPCKKIHPEATLPTRAHPDDAGLDLYALEDVMVPVGEGKMARTGIAFALPAKTVGMIADRSSMAKKGLKTAGGIIDAGYRGEVQVVFWNLSKQEIRIARGERMAQMLILPIETPAVQEASSLDDTTRGAGGFGSTGR